MWNDYYRVAVFQARNVSSKHSGRDFTDSAWEELLAPLLVTCSEAAAAELDVADSARAVARIGAACASVAGSVRTPTPSRTSLCRMSHKCVSHAGGVKAGFAQLGLLQLSLSTSSALFSVSLCMATTDKLPWFDVPCARSSSCFKYLLLGSG